MIMLCSIFYRFRGMFGSASWGSAYGSNLSSPVRNQDAVFEGLRMKRIAVFAAICLIPALLQAQQDSSSTKILVFSRVTVIDGTGATPSPDQTVVIESDRITRITRELQLAVGGYAPQKLADLAALFAKNFTWQDPTLVSSNVVAHANDANFARDSRLAYVPSAERESWTPENNMFVKFSPPEYWVQRGAALREELAIVGELHRAGVPFLAGTDSGGVPCTYPGFSLHDELAFLVQAGFTPMEALQTATLNPARFLGLADQLGTVAQGKQANLVLLEANPLDDIRITQKIRAVVVRGRYLDRAVLDTLLARAKADRE
jgi:hypothetical protein